MHSGEALMTPSPRWANSGSSPASEESLRQSCAYDSPQAVRMEAFASTPGKVSSGSPVTPRKRPLTAARRRREAGTARRAVLTGLAQPGLGTRGATVDPVADFLAEARDTTRAIGTAPPGTRMFAAVSGLRMRAYTENG